MKAGSAGVPPAQHWHSLTPLSHPARPATAPRFHFSRAQAVPAGRVGRAPHHGETERPPNPEDAGETPALPEGRLLPSFLLREEALPLPMRQCRPASCPFVVLRVSSVKHPIVNRGEPRMNTNRHEFQWTSLAAKPSREEALRERGRPARTTLAQPRPSAPPGSTGNGATIPLQPSPGGSCRQGGQGPHHGEAERPTNIEDAGETPALPEGRLSRLSSGITLFSLSIIPIGVHSCPFVVRRFPSWITLFSSGLLGDRR